MKRLQYLMWTVFFLTFFFLPFVALVFHPLALLLGNGVLVQLSLQHFIWGGFFIIGLFFVLKRKYLLLSDYVIMTLPVPLFMLFGKAISPFFFGMKWRMLIREGYCDQFFDVQLLLILTSLVAYLILRACVLTKEPVKELQEKFANIVCVVVFLVIGTISFLTPMLWIIFTNLPNPVVMP